MNRVIPIVIIVALLLMGGIWLSRKSNMPIQAQQNQNTETTEESTTEEPESTTEESTTEESTTEESTETTESTDTTATESGETTDSETVVDNGIPEGFTQSPYLSETQQRNFEKAEQVLEEGKDYQALIITSKGTIRVDLYETDVPKTVNNFVFLARNRYYDGIIFHRVIEGFMAQTGDPTGTGSGGPGYEFEDEIVEGLVHDKRGTLSMANAGPGTNGSQFFITFDATPWLDGKHTIFGTVLEGDAVLDSITRIEPGSSPPPTAIVNLDETLAIAEERGIKLSGDPSATLSDYLTTTLGSVPDIGMKFELDGFKAQSGRLGEIPAIGFWTAEAADQSADVMKQVVIIEKLKD
jgi:cyclophilin family peptidyl-prolyl cis-trans isomerase